MVADSIAPEMIKSAEADLVKLSMTLDIKQNTHLSSALWTVDIFRNSIEIHVVFGWSFTAIKYINIYIYSSFYVFIGTLKII